MVSDDRAQVLLLGGLAIAIVFLTAIPLSNSLVVSESASTSETVADIDRAAEREASVERGVRALVREADADDPAALNRSLNIFSRYYTNVSGQQDGVYVNATVDIGESEQRLNLSGLEDPGTTGRDAREWQPVNETRSITGFNLTLTDAPPSKYIYVNITNESGYRYTLRARRGPGPDTLVVETFSTTDATTAICDSFTGEITVRVVSGSCSGTGDVHSFPPNNENSEVSFDLPDSGNPGGRFELTAAGQFDDSVQDDLNLTNPAVDLNFVGPQTSYQRTIQVNETS
ncbi:hypothetical protein [Haloarcula laminariae]|uniref:hypothetical protein n=1 Tax=Haloarcula laminariae TaxID=2961577 RepID=UPI0021C5BD0F|nr:hypothetical protein [Halomicroarcula laminariae]